MLTQAEAAQLRTALSTAIGESLALMVAPAVDAAMSPFVAAPVPVPPVPAPLPTGVVTLLDLDLTDGAAVFAAVPYGDCAGADVNNKLSGDNAPTFGVDPTGLHYLRCGVDPATGTRVISWFYRTPADVDELYISYPLWIEDDVALGMNELGVKLPGLMSRDYVAAAISARLEHGPFDPATGTYNLRDYIYDAGSGSGFGRIDNTTGNPAPGRWHVVEQRGKLNTPGKPDGALEIKLNGVLVFASATENWRADPAVRFGGAHINIYHGGNNAPKAPIHYRIGRIRVGTGGWLGAPPELVGYVPPPLPGPIPQPVPQPVPVPLPSAPGAFTPIAGTAQLSGQVAKSAIPLTGGMVIDDWNGLAAYGTRWYSWGSSGHDNGTGQGHGNGAYELDLSAATRAWVMRDPGSPPAMLQIKSSYNLDDKAVARHSYTSTQAAKWPDGVVRVMLFGVQAPDQAGVPGAGFNGAACAAFNTVTGKTEPIGFIPDTPVVPQLNGTSWCRDPRNDDVYGTGGSSFVVWRCLTNSWEVLGNLAPAYPDLEQTPMLIDGKRNAWVILVGQRNGNVPQLVSIDLATHAVTVRAITGSFNGFQSYCAMVHDTDADRYVFVDSGSANFSVPASAHAIDPATAAATLIQTFAGPAVNGVQNRLAYFQTLGGIAYLPGFDSDVLWMPTR